MKEETPAAARSGKRRSSGERLSLAVKTYIEGHSAEKFSLQTMADALFVNGSYLLRTFKRHTGFTPLEYHHRVRCEKARELLAGTDQSVSRVGETVGFVSSSHFSHIFKRVEGCTPTEYRLNHAIDGMETANIKELGAES